MSDDLGVVLQCGGWGTRLGIHGPKALYPLPGGETPLSLMLEEIPDDIPVYIHTIKEQMSSFEVYMNLEFGGRKDYSIIVQSETPLLDCQSNPVFADGKQVMVSDGVATFGNKLVNPPKYLLIMDGCQLGLDFPETQDALSKLKKSDLDAIVLARELKDEEIEEEVRRRNSPGGRITYARVHPNKKSIIEQQQVSDDILRDKEWLGTLGHHVVRTERFLAETLPRKGELYYLSVIKGKVEGFAYQLRTLMIYRDYLTGREGLSFDVYRSNTDKVGLKERKDVETWRKNNPNLDRKRKSPQVVFDFELPMASNKMEAYCW